MATQSMFGPSPYEIQQQRQDQTDALANKFAQMNAAQRGAMGMFQGGAGLGQVAGRAVGLVDPQEQQAQQMQSSAADINFEDPKSLRVLAERVRGMGNLNGAFDLVQKASAIEAGQQKARLDRETAARADSRLNFDQNQAFELKQKTQEDKNNNEIKRLQDVAEAKERDATNTAKSTEQRALAASEANATRVMIAQMVNSLGQQKVNSVGPKLTKGQESADREFGKEYAIYQAGGGSADIEKQLTQLKFVADALAKKGNDYTGPVKGLIPDWARPFTNADAVAAKNKVEEVAQRNLRMVLGAQFTQVEGERLIARAYNPQLSPKENAGRVNALIKQIRTAAQTKDDAARHFEEQGTLTGWKGRMPTLSDFENTIDSAGKDLPNASTETYEQRKARILK